MKKNFAACRTVLLHLCRCVPVPLLRPVCWVVALLASASAMAQAPESAPLLKPAIISFTALTNYAGEPSASPNLKVRRYNAEMSSSRPGWVLPHPAADPAGPVLFDCRFSIQNASARDTLYYALFYQNESSAFPAGHPRDDENFYGTWGHDESRAPGFRPVVAARAAGPLVISTGLRLRGNPRNEPLYCDGPPPFLADGENDVARFGRWKRPPRMGRYRFMLVVTSDTSEIDFYARDCHRCQPDGRYLNPFTYFQTQPLARTAVLLADEQLHVYMRPANLGAPLAPRGWNEPQSAEQLMASFRHGTYGGSEVENVPVVADATSPDFTPAAYNRLKHRFDDSVLAKVVVGRDGPTTAFAEPGRIRLVNPPAEPVNPHKYDASVRTVMGFTYGRFRARIRFPQIVNPAGVWTGINPAFWFFSASAERWNALDRGYAGDFCADDGRTAVSEIDLEVYKAPCYPYHYYANDGYGGSPRQRRRWLRKGGKFQDETCDSVTLACNNFDYMRRSIPQQVNGSTATPPCSTVGNDVPVAYQGKAFRLHRDGPNPVLSCRPIFSARELFAPNATWFEIEWRPTEIIWRMGPDEEHLRVIGYMSDQYTVVPTNLMHVIIGQHWLATSPFHSYWQEKLPYPAKAMEGEILEFSVE